MRAGNVSHVGVSMKLGISEASRRAGVDRKVLYRMMEKGKLSKELTEDGSPVIDLSELARVFPSAATVTGQEGVRQRKNGQSVTAGAQQVIDALNARIASHEAREADLRRDLDHERRERERDRGERDRLLALVEDHSATVRQLTDQRAAQPTPAKPGLWARLTGR